MKHKNTAKRVCSVAIVVIMTVMSVWALIGCSLIGWFLDDGYVKFTRGSLTLQLGDTFNLVEIIESDTSTYTLDSSDSDIVSVNRRTITANAVGVAYITAETNMYSDRIRITVTDIEQDSLSVEAHGSLVQTMGNTSTVLFSANATGSLASRSVGWYVDGEMTSSLYAEEIFEFTPSAAAVYEITAKIDDFSATETVRCYYEVSASVSVSGALEQSAQPFSDIKFSVNIERDPRNPADRIEWYSDGDRVYSGESVEFVYSPTPGRHTVEAFVNGMSVYSVNGMFRGAVTPSKPNVEFDNAFPHVYIEHDAIGNAAVEIVSPYGTTEVYKQTDANYSHLFTDKGFDAGEFIALCSSSNLRRSYHVRVKSLGDGDVYTESEFSDVYTFVQLPSTAKRYVETLCLNSDLYVTSDYEYAQLLEYYIINRKKVANASVAFDCYIAYSMSGDAEDLWNDAFQVAATSGMYKNISVSINNGIMRTSFVVDTVNTPSRQASESYGSRRAAQLHAVLPHINYDEEKYRSSDHEFYIDAAERSASVTYTDELYLAVERGVKPLPTAGSPASTVYELCRDVMHKICTDDMTDVQKAHAIYDWIMWKVVYDTPATLQSSGGEECSAYYLEGVFADGSTAIGGKVYQPYAVCDGISKAYSLMCNMEGIPCVRVAGTAGSTPASAGGHAWNKVKVNGEWYAVDCTWGDSIAALDLGGRGTDYELGLHEYLFLTQSQIDEEHYEPYQVGDSSIKYAPAATEKPLNIYKQLEYNDTVIDSYVGSGQNETERVREIVTEYAKAYINIGTIKIPGETSPSRVSYNGFEIMFENGVAMSNNALKTLIDNTIRAARPSLRVKTYITGNIVLVLIS